jgi:hypothetical protein
MSQSPTSKTFPFRRGTVGSFAGNSCPLDDGKYLHYVQAVYKINYRATDDGIDTEQKGANKVHRRATTAWSGGNGDRFQQPTAPKADNRQERATGLLRRLSLSTSFTKVIVTSLLCFICRLIYPTAAWC